ncbi:aminopeptidase [Wukongibacter baidiensis]|uniref:aminopeptidase n=1 Tax=Wukongibacter baidiensis TaxID=1723361 RepID=UPI003D7F1DF5
MDNKIISAISSANNIIKNLLAVKPGEEVLICTDPETDMRMVNAFAAATLECGAEYTIAMMPTRTKEKAVTISKTLEKAMEGCDVYIPMTRTSGASAYNSKMKELLLKKQIRECCMVLRDIDNYIKGGALADYEKVYADGKRLAEIWKDKKLCRITTPAGTDLTAEMISAEPIIECGIARNPGESMAFSDGEVSVGPVEGTMNGTLVLDGPMCYFGSPLEPVKMTIKNGKVVSIDGGDRRITGEFRNLFETIENSDNIAEIGIGLNPNSLMNGDFEEEKKARGTVHIAFGNGVYYGQNRPTADSQVHIDAVLYAPTVTFDDELIVKDGKVVALGDE